MLAVGLLFGVSGFRPVPVIIVAQALNGVLLPLVAVFLLVAVNDRSVMGERVNRTPSNVVMALVTLVSVLLGTAGVLRAGARVVGREAPGQSLILAVSVVVAVALAVPMVRALRQRRNA